MQRIKKLGVLVMLLSLLLPSCKKEHVGKDADPNQFDINNPLGYFIYVKAVKDDGSSPKPMLFEFGIGKTFKLYGATPDGNGSTITAYEVTDGNVVALAGSDVRFVIDKDRITSNDPRFIELALIKAPEINQLTGKTFAGTYYKSDTSIHHSNFFYSFSGNGSEVGAGINIGTIVRTENYNSIGNLAAWVDVSRNNDVEFMVLVNGKLEVNYYQKKDNTRYYGSFTQR